MNPADFIRNIHLTRKHAWLAILAAFAALIILGVAAPMIDASHYGERIRQTLQTTLGRNVQFQAVHFTLFSGPGFSLEGVTIGEDPRYGVEDFAYVPELQVRVRPDKLLFGQVQISSLRLLDPSLNLMKREDGTWNALELIGRLGAPRRMPLSFFPVFEVLRGRIDFKFGTRKTTLYLLDADLQIFPERSNRLKLDFSGSPARTDRAGNGFGHLHGSVSWVSNRVNAKDNRVEADLTLDPSNLSEVTTLIEGQDAGVHGTVSSHAVVEGPLEDLHVRGRMQLSDVHRWDLLPANGNEWQVAYGGDIDLVASRLALKTFPGGTGETSPITLELLMNNFLRNPALSLLAHLVKAPAGQVLPLVKRMGWELPPNLALTGNVSGDVSLTSQSGLGGNIVLEDVVAALPHVDPLRAARVEASLAGDRVSFRPTQIQAASGNFQVGGEVSVTNSQSAATVVVSGYPVLEIKKILNAWLGAPASFEFLDGGEMTGAFSYSSSRNVDPVWSGKFDFQDASLHLPGLSSPLVNAAGRVNFNGPNLDLTRFSAMAGNRLLQASYRYNPQAKRVEHLHIDLPAAELSEMEALLAPTVQGQGWLARLGVTSRSVPAWLSSRDMEADISIKQLFIGDLNTGSLTSQFTWQGTNLRFSSVRLKMAAGSMQAHGTASLVSYRPKCAFTASVNQYPWRGGILDADGEVETFGLAQDVLKNLHASGTFKGTNLRLTAEDSFPALSGGFLFSYRDGWPDLRFLTLQAVDRDGDWNGSGTTQSDGRLIVELEHAGQQRRIVSSLVEGADSPALVANH